MEAKKKFAVFAGVLMSMYLIGLFAQIVDVALSILNAPLDKKISLNIGTGLNEIVRGLRSYPCNMYALCLLVGVGIYLYFKFSTHTNLEDRFRVSKENLHGSSGFMDRKKAKKVYDIIKTPNELKRNGGTILGETKYGIILFPIKSWLNRNIAVFGASGSMKTRAYVFNMIFQCVKRGESIVITDPKMEIFKLFKLYLESKGYIVKAFNTTAPEYSDSWNCLSETEGDEILTQVFCDVIMQNTSKGHDNGFWSDGVQNLLKALVLYIYQNKPIEQRNIGEVYKLLVSKDLKTLTALFNKLDNNNSAKQCFNVFDRATDGVKVNTITGLAGRLQVFQAEAIKKMTSIDDIDITALGQKKCAYFLITSDQDSTFDFLGSLFISFVFIKNVRYADKYANKNKLPVPIHILADEIANIGEIPDLKKKISTVRSRGISLSVIFQSIAQMENRYSNNQWQEIIGNCDTQLFLGCTDEATAKYISNRSGEVTAEKKDKTFNVVRKEKRQSFNQRKLLTPDEVLRLDSFEGLVITRGQKLIPITKFDYTKHPEYKQLKELDVTQYIPQYTNTLEENKVNQQKGVAYEKKKKSLCEQRLEEKETTCKKTKCKKTKCKKSETQQNEKVQLELEDVLKEQQYLHTNIDMEGGDSCDSETKEDVVEIGGDEIEIQEIDIFEELL